MKKIFMCVALVTSAVFILPQISFAAYRFSNFEGHPPTHIHESALTAPRGLSPDQIKSAYNLPKTGGTGAIALIGAYDNATIEADLKTFSTQFNLPQCTSSSGCFEVHKMSPSVKKNTGWALETAMDVEWSHAVAPNANILLIEATTQSGKNLLAAIDYACSRKDVTAVSMSWGGPEFADELSLEKHFNCNHPVTFFASSGDNGAGVSWPASSASVVAVGGTTLNFGSNGSVTKETAWSGSGGGVSAYISAPSSQADYKISRANGMRAVPDVSYDADPASGVAVYSSSGPQKVSAKKGGWYTLGGTSAGAPQWAGIFALGKSATLENLYSDKAKQNSADYFRDITSGTNGDCGYLCTARKHYDYVTGLGSPLTVKF